ncbi:MAG: hypothetical protein A2086_11680 [Spirochaetes bacterium GWD1_27_9]|nr:MAG: hypothetical protein A2Z98_03405 [Spirochaetes bacterium GWB1_27_13]OHD21430.1 MAG: hypothetical protein A2Y34_05565 [Spirochaetes bacterium GWC1_27_15]OHD28623.1 MAG: hypothetical protein A2086_11680 [Spirochaetes bacterium GWD1_27_9]
MEDRSIVKPIIDSIEYFNNSEIELQYFYKVIDRFCAAWFGRSILSNKFKEIDLLLIHDLLGEYLRFEENSKRIALWLLSINRVCYNYTADLSMARKETGEMLQGVDGSVDTSLISQILIIIRELEEKHLTAGQEDKGQGDTIGNFLQWVGIYTTYIYPSLENKSDYYDKNIVKAMNFLLSEFIQQRSNDKRLAYLILAIMEACKQYSLQSANDQSNFVSDYNHIDGLVFAGKEESLVEELLNKLRDENEKQRKRPGLTKEILADEFIKDTYDKFIEDLNSDVSESVSVFNKYTFDLANKFLTFDTGKQFLFLQTLSRYRASSKDSIKPSVYSSLKNSVNLLSSRTKNWLKNELERLESQKDIYIEYIIQKLLAENSASKTNTAKLFVMLYLIKKLELFL